MPPSGSRAERISMTQLTGSWRRRRNGSVSLTSVSSRASTMLLHDAFAIDAAPGVEAHDLVEADAHAQHVGGQVERSRRTRGSSRSARRSLSKTVMPWRAKSSAYCSMSRFCCSVVEASSMSRSAAPRDRFAAAAGSTAPAATRAPIARGEQMFGEAKQVDVGFERGRTSCRATP